MRLTLRYGTIALTACCMFVTTKANSLGVSPATTIMQGVTPGETIDTGQDLVISNDKDEDLDVIIETIKPMMPGHESLKGYSPLPNLKFAYTDKKRLTLPAKGKGSTRIFISVPAEEKYYNQHWAFSIRIKTAKMEFMRAAIAPFFIMDTVEKTDIKEIPEGNIGIVPSLVEIKREDTKKKKAVFTIYNNTTEEHKYSVKSYVSDQSGNGFKIGVTGWYEWLKDLQWAKPVNPELVIGAGGKKEAEISVELPESLETAEDRKGWEVLVNVESEKLERRFVRLRINN